MASYSEDDEIKLILDLARSIGVQMVYVPNMDAYLTVVSAAVRRKDRDAGFFWARLTRTQALSYLADINGGTT